MIEIDNSELLRLLRVPDNRALFNRLICGEIENGDLIYNRSSGKLELADTPKS